MQAHHLARQIARDVQKVLEARTQTAHSAQVKLPADL
jgi:hypothetical protein